MLTMILCLPPSICKNYEVMHISRNVYDQFSLFWHENAYSKYYQEIKTIFMNIHKEGHQL